MIGKKNVIDYIFNKLIGHWWTHEKWHYVTSCPSRQWFVHFICNEKSHLFCVALLFSRQKTKMKKKRIWYCSINDNKNYDWSWHLTFFSSLFFFYFYNNRPKIRSSHDKSEKWVRRQSVSQKNCFDDEEFLCLLYVGLAWPSLINATISDQFNHFSYLFCSDKFKNVLLRYDHQSR